MPAGLSAQIIDEGGTVSEDWKSARSSGRSAQGICPRHKAVVTDGAPSASQCPCHWIVGLRFAADQSTDDIGDRFGIIVAQANDAHDGRFPVGSVERAGNASGLGDFRPGAAHQHDIAPFVCDCSGPTLLAAHDCLDGCSNIGCRPLAKGNRCKSCHFGRCTTTVETSGKLSNAGDIIRIIRDHYGVGIGDRF